MTYFEWQESLDRAAALAAEMEDLGFAATTYADPNGVPACQVFLTEERGEYAPCLMMGTEGTMSIGPSNGAQIEAVEWNGSLYNFGVEMFDPSVRMNERPHLGHGVAEIAEELAPFVEVLIGGAAKFHRAHPVEW